MTGYISKKDMANNRGDIMKTTIVDNYLWTVKYDNIDNEKLYNTCMMVEQTLLNVYPDGDDRTHGSFTARYHGAYNLFTFPCPELHKLNSNLSILVSDLLQDQYYIKCWVNIFKPNKNIDWHAHWPAELMAYHGFYCVNTEGEHGSYTDYRIPNNPEIRVPSEDGLLVIGKSAGDEHRSSIWQNTDKHRITIAFDIIPVSTLRTRDDFYGLVMHNYIPLPKV
jgi:hypothetical protein